MGLLQLASAVTLLCLASGEAAFHFDRAQPLSFGGSAGHGALRGGVEGLHIPQPSQWGTARLPTRLQSRSPAMSQVAHTAVDRGLLARRGRQLYYTGRASRSWKTLDDTSSSLANSSSVDNTTCPCAAPPSLCDGNNTDISPSWCFLNNPFMTVLNISDVKYGKNDCWGSGCNVPRDEGVQFECDGDDPFSSCRSVLDICTFQALTQYIPVYDPETGEAFSRKVPPGEMQRRKMRFLLMGLVSGQIVANYIDPSLPLDFAFQRNGLVFQAHQDPVDHVTALSGLEWHTELGSMATFTASSATATKIWVMNTTVFPPDEVFPLCASYSHGNYKLLEVTTFRSAALVNTSVTALLLQDNTDDRNVRIVFLLADLEVDQHLCRENLRVLEWQVVLPTGAKPVLGMAIYTQRANLGSYFVDTDVGLNRTLIFLFSTKRISGFEFDNSFRAPRSTTVPFGGAQGPSVLLAIEDPAVTLLSVGAYGEFFRRPRLTGEQATAHTYELLPTGNSTHIPPRVNGTLRPSELVWITAGVVFGSQSYVGLLSLEELAQQVYEPRPPSGYQPETDPAQLTQTADGGGPAAACYQTSARGSNSQFYDLNKKGCQNRTAESYTLPTRVLSVAVAMKGWPDTKGRPGAGQSFSDCQNVRKQCPGESACPAYIQCLRNATGACAFQSLQQDEDFKKLQATFLRTIIFVHTVDSSALHDVLYAVGTRQIMCSSNAAQTAGMNRLAFVGRLSSLHVSPNSMHLFAAVKRQYFDLQGIARLHDICEKLDNDPTNVFLKDFSSACDQAGHRGPPNVNDFAWYVSSCMPGVYCPDWNLASIFPADGKPIREGLYTQRSFEIRLCDPGYFCYQGAKQQCPPGFICPQFNLSRPLSCNLLSPNVSLSCFHSHPNYLPGLTKPNWCQTGAVCVVPYLPGFPVMEGYSNTALHPTRFQRCPNGTWCVLGRSRTALSRNAMGQVNGSTPVDLACPANTFCSSSSVLTPTICNFTAELAHYCPAGSYQQLPCPAGYFCSRPDAKTECSAHRYCPPGKVKPETCPAGFYCPNPSQRIICPAGHYCRPGSSRPRPCGALTDCPEGTTSQKSTAVFPLIVFIIFAVPAISWHYYKKTRDRKREDRDRRRALGLSVSVTTSFRLWPMSSSKNAKAHEEPLLDEEEKDDKLTIDFEFENLGLALKGSGKSVLSGVSGMIRHGRVTAVMGPSGAGKSTFITTLCGKASYGVQTGTVMINGKVEPLTKYKKLVGFVPQEDIMNRSLTVKEILKHNAKLRLPTNVSVRQRAQVVNDAITKLGLWDIRHSRIGDEENRGISGGQRKRVNIGMELVAKPTVLFLDEPTSGLDSTSSFEVGQCLRDIAETGMTIVTVIHQPRYEIFRMFHDVLLLGKGGKTVYLGPSERALDYFTSLGFQCPEHTNPPDFMMDVISGDVPRQGHPEFESSDLFEEWERHRHEYLPKPRSSHAPAGNSMISHSASSDKGRRGSSSGGAVVSSFDYSGLPDYQPRQTAGFWRQLYLFTSRALILQSRSWGLLLFDLILTLAGGLFFGLVYYQRFYVGPESKSVVAQCPQQLLDQNPSPCKIPRDDPLPGQAATATLALGLAAVAGSLRVYGSERTVFWRESSTGTSTLAFFLGQQIAHSASLLLAPLCFLLFFYQLVTPFASFGSMYAICLCIYWTAAGYGYVVSIVAPPMQAQLFGVLAILVSMMFAGLNPRFVQLKKILGGVLMYPTYVSFIRWAEEAYYLNEIQHYQDIYDDIQTGMDLYEYDLDHFTTDMVMLVSIGVALRIAAYLALEFMHRDKRV